MTEQPFVSYLIGLKSRDDKGALAVLRRGLGKDGGTADMYPYIFRFNPPKWHENSYFLVASLFAFHPMHTDADIGFGKAVLRLKQKNSSNSLEKRFIRLLDADREELSTLLRSFFSMFKSEDIALNYHSFMRDMIYFGENVTKQWARDFWYENNEKTEEA